MNKRRKSSVLLKSTRYKKLAQNALLFTYSSLKSCKSHEKIKTKNISLLFFSFSSINLLFWCFLFYFIMWFARFQILICELQSIWRKLLVLSWLYPFFVKGREIFKCFNDAFAQKYIFNITCPGKTPLKKVLPGPVLPDMLWIFWKVVNQINLKHLN